MGDLCDETRILIGWKSVLNEMETHLEIEIETVISKMKHDMRERGFLLVDDDVTVDFIGG